MSEGLSQSIVNFIASLLPLYTCEMVGDVPCARSLVDGTLVFPVEEPEGEEQGFVEVHWQGDPARHTEVQGVFLASQVVARYAEMHAIPTGSATKVQYAHIAQHFTFKTGQSLVLGDGSEDEVLLGLVSKATKVIGKEALIEVLKKSLGL